MKVLLTQSCSTLRPHGLLPARLLCPWSSPGKNTGVGSHSLLQGIVPTQGSNPATLQADSLPSEPSEKPTPPLSLWQPPSHSFILWISLFGIPNLSGIVHYFFRDWFFSLNKKSSNLIHAVAYCRMCFFFLKLNIFHCMYKPQFLYPFICQWTFRVFPHLGYCEYNEHGQC